ncbi:hypothetical protein M011DRAFT_408633 [Sporormia fimetaria CBS 119925]|uniref:LYR motif-containing protein Cup1-like N-terminal domain-containing protein n=1 Tax=Sporormia fimetaria CBS 119925 TaxID=1340428 RepID=A0A6A6V4Y7_9PLEO|nr:hypothetical protein M011DRAFT_408633 [Sporormia fimetaria CBS 119925]
MKTAPPTPSQLKSLHLFRALLREASYLPDATLRSHFHRHIVNRFKAYQPTHNATATAERTYRRSGYKRRYIDIIDARTSEAQKRAKKGLNHLRSANAGNRRDLQKLMLFAYGRIGRRKYILLDDLMKPDPEAKGAEDPGPSPLQKHYYSDRPNLRFFDAPKDKIHPGRKVANEVSIDFLPRYSRLKAALKGQAQRNVSLGPPLRRVSIIIDKYNVWQRPMPIKRARNDVNRWYKDTMTKLLPPLPNYEWDELHALASGAAKWLGPVARRTPARTLQPIIDNPIARSKTVIDVGLALDKPAKADRLPDPRRPMRDQVSPRFMRRLYAYVLQYCCKLEYDEKRRSWVTHWATLNATPPPVYSKPVDAGLFEGVDAQGKVIT